MESVENISFEPFRGCGLRVIGKLYVRSGNEGISCDRLNITLQECQFCGYVPSFFRGYRKIYPKILLGGNHKNCEDEVQPCPICQPEDFPFEADSFIMYVGKKYYTPQSFIQEAQRLGVSKAISNIPNGMVAGKSWIFLAYQQLSEEELGTTFQEGTVKTIKKDAIFYAFKVKAFEVLITEEQNCDEELLKCLAEHGITPVVVPHKYTDFHKSNRSSNFVERLYEKWKEEQAKKLAQEPTNKHIPLDKYFHKFNTELPPTKEQQDEQPMEPSQSIKKEEQKEEDKQEEPLSEHLLEDQVNPYPNHPNPFLPKTKEQLEQKKSLKELKNKNQKQSYPICSKCKITQLRSQKTQERGICSKCFRKEQAILKKQNKVKNNGKNKNNN